VATAARALRTKRILGGALLALALAVLASSTAWSSPAQASAVTSIPNFKHVIVVMYENHGWDQIVGDTTDAPTFNSLATQYAQMTDYDAVFHPSLPNYLAITSGSNDGITYDCKTCVVNVKNLADQIEKVHKTWKTYAEDLPSPGATGISYGGTNGYVKRHVPFMYYRDIVKSKTRRAHIVPFTQLAKDVKTKKLPNFSLIIPTLNDDMHNGTIAQGDAWLKKHIVPLLKSPALGSNSVVFVVFDEALDSDTTGGGGHIDVLALGPQVMPGSTFTGLTSHYGLLATIEDAWHMPLLANAKTATPITGIWK
jgi:acid phosphatase